MAVPVTQFQVLHLLLQIEQNINGLQRDVRANAAAWKASAQAQDVPVATLAQYLSDAARSYQARLGWLSALQADTGNWARVTSLWLILGGSVADFESLMTPFATIANLLGSADTSGYGQIMAVCDQILSAIDAPLSLWPE